MTPRAPTLVATLLLAVNAAGCAVVGYPAPTPAPAPGGRVVAEGASGSIASPGARAAPQGPSGSTGSAGGRADSVVSPGSSASTGSAGAPTSEGSAGFRSRDPRDPRSYEVLGQTYTTLATSEGYVETGLASWYGQEFQGRRTASGEPYDMHLFTAAHRTLPLGSCVDVKRVSDERSVVVRINDRGPFDDDRRRIIDVSFAAAEKLGLIGTGTATIELTALPGDTRC